MAMETFPPAPNHVTIFAQSGIDDPIIHVLAEWATQFRPTLSAELLLLITVLLSIAQAKNSFKSELTIASVDLKFIFFMV